MFKKVGGIIAAASFAFLVLGTIARAKGIVFPFIKIITILGLWGTITGSILYFIGKFQEIQHAKGAYEISSGSNAFCSICGTENKSDAKFCITCGTAKED